jgi:hypothetical protein
MHGLHPSGTCLLEHASPKQEPRQSRKVAAASNIWLTRKLMVSQPEYFARAAASSAAVAGAPSSTLRWRSLYSSRCLQSSQAATRGLPSRSRMTSRGSTDNRSASCKHRNSTCSQHGWSSDGSCKVGCSATATQRQHAYTVVDSAGARAGMNCKHHLCVFAALLP